MRFPPPPGTARRQDRQLTGSALVLRGRTQHRGSKADPRGNPRRSLIVSLAGLGEEEKSFKDDAAYLPRDEARVIDGERRADARGFSDRLARVLERALRPTG
jgi:hypothetical protein